jgi:uncharacterized protein (DUF983 family)
VTTLKAGLIDGSLAVVMAVVGVVVFGRAAFPEVAAGVFVGVALARWGPVVYEEVVGQESAEEVSS